VSAQRVFRNHFNISRNDLVPSAHAIKTWIKNLEETGSTLRKQIGSVRSARAPDNVGRVEDALHRSPTRPARRFAFLIAASKGLYTKISATIRSGCWPREPLPSYQQLLNPDLVNNPLMSDEALSVSRTVAIGQVKPSETP
jgi:hypothetical protein